MRVLAEYRLLAVLFGIGIFVATLGTMDWHARRIVAEFAEQLVGVTLHVAALLGGGTIGFVAGARAADRSRSDLLGWAVGLATFIAIGFAVSVQLRRFVN